MACNSEFHVSSTTLIWPDTHLHVYREGVFFFELAPAAGERTYAWDKKVSIAMSCSEIANILENPNKEWSFYHDPSKCVCRSQCTSAGHHAHHGQVQLSMHALSLDIACVNSLSGRCMQTGRGVP